MPQVNVIEATWGALQGSVDVTAIVQQLIEGGATSITAGNPVFGPDPAPGIVKHFAMSYRVGQTRYTAACGESETVNVALTPQFVVLDAVFGATAGAVDVKAAVQGLVNAGVITITPGVNVFPDPAPGVVKHFAMAYTNAAGTRRTIACGEAETFTLE